MNKYFFCIILLFAFSCKSNVATNNDENKAAPSIVKYGINYDNYFIKTQNVRNGDLFTTILIRAGLSANEVQTLIEASKGIFDVTKIKSGNSYELLYKKVSGVKAVELPENEPKEQNIDRSREGAEEEISEGDLKYFIYEKDKTSHVVIGVRDSIFVKVVEKDIVVNTKSVEVEISSSLWVDATRAGVPVPLIAAVSDIYAWTIDFFGLQKGDAFKVLYDELSYQGEFVDIGPLYYAEFISEGKPYYAVRFTDGKGGNMYWNEKGESMRKAFLKAPLDFVRISSGFTYARKHPVLKIVRPHTGVDYAAPKGTPVKTIGDGVVVQRGWSGGGGNTIKIKHNSTFTTSYMHLNSFAKGLKVGGRDKQGEIIGTVGSTGLSTGPHLDFRVYKNGSPINPLKMDSPAAEPISKALLGDFKLVLDKYKHQLDSLESYEYFSSMIDVLK